jgi:hypothetical protein
MSKWVTRRDIDGRFVSDPELCLENNQSARESGVRTIDERIATLLEHHEIVEGHQGLRKIHARGSVVGFFEISAQRPSE